MKIASRLRNQSQSLDHRIYGSVLSRSAGEFFGTSALFPMLLTIHTITAEGLGAVLHEPATFALFGAAIFQAWLIGAPRQRTPVRTFFGNISGFIVYALIDSTIEGPGFFQAVYHWVFAAFSLGIAVVETIAAVREQKRPDTPVLRIVSNILKILLFPALYFLIDSELVQVSDWFAGAIPDFLSSAGHQYLVIGAILFGILLGLGDSQRQRFQNLVQKTAGSLKEYSQWSMDASLIQSALDDPDALQLRRVTRTVLFMDIRGFTRWSEHQDPAAVVAMLNRYYLLAEQRIKVCGAHKPGHTADEVMTRHNRPDAVFDLALDLIDQLKPVLEPIGLSVGIGIETGPVIEGMIGSSGTRKFDIIGDTVNTAKRLESAARANQIVLSGRTAGLLTGPLEGGSAESIPAKGKADPIPIIRVQR